MRLEYVARCSGWYLVATGLY